MNILPDKLYLLPSSKFINVTDEVIVSESKCGQSDDDVLLYEPELQEVEDTQVKHTGWDTVF